MYTARLFPPIRGHRYRAPSSVAASTALGFPQLVHLGDALLELDILALLVAVSLVLRGWSSQPACLAVWSDMVSGSWAVPRTSMAGSRSRTGSG